MCSCLCVWLKNFSLLQPVVGIPAEIAGFRILFAGPEPSVETEGLCDFLPLILATWAAELHPTFQQRCSLRSLENRTERFVSGGVQLSRFSA
mmetsp:Transcript_17724/g.42516  ORF Transcript_17724/g.42516 Transcript_17724/m.42516 type:complete len:92 (+) Transcript_17724:43-318(+)